MRKINKKYRDKNKVTYVLSFQESKVIFEKFKTGPLTKIRGLGEIIICLRETKKEAKRRGVVFEKELGAYLVHGMLHLLGYDHKKDEKEAKRMQRTQDYYLEQIFKVQ